MTHPQLRPATHTATLYGHVYTVPVRKDGAYWVSTREVHLAHWHSRRDVTDLVPIGAHSPNFQRGSEAGCYS